MARIPSGDRRADVADQEGLKSSLIGLSIAVFLGLILRSTLNSQYVEDQIRGAAQRIHQDLRIDFEGARLSLSRHGIPELAAIVENIKFNSATSCWSEPEGQIDELRLPLNLWQMIRGELQITEIKIGHMNLKLHSKWKECHGTEMSKSLSVKSTAAPNADEAVETAKPSSERPQARGPIRDLSIDSLKIEYLPFSSIPFDFEDIALRRKNVDDFKMLLTGLMNLGGSSLSGDYASQAEFRVDIEDPQFDLDLRGTWREGRYLVKANFDSQKRDVQIKGDIDNLPLSQILSLATQFGWIEGEYDSRQLWLNMKFDSGARHSVDQPVPIKISSFGLEGDLGEIKGEDLSLQVGSEFRLNPGELRLRGLKPEKILTLLGRESKFASFGSLGEMNGSLIIKDLRSWSFLGESSGIEVVFSNRGERRLQILSIISGKVEFNQGNWVLLIDKVRPLEGLFLGSLRLEGYANKPNVDLELLVEEMSLAPEVQALMSGGGSLGRWSGEIKAILIKNQPKKLSGVLTGQSLLIEGLQAERVRLSLSETNERIVTDIKAQGLEVLPNTPLRRFFSTLFAPVQYDPNLILRASQFSGQIQTGIQTQELVWKFKPVSFDGLEMRSEGGWSQIFELYGDVSVSSKGMEARWKVEGDREKPIFTQK